MKSIPFTVFCAAALAPVTGSAIVFNYSSDIVTSTAVASTAWQEFYPAFSYGVQYVGGAISMDHLPSVDLRADDANLGLYRVENATMSIAGTNSITGAVIEELFTGALEISIFSDSDTPFSRYTWLVVMHIVGFADVEGDGPPFGPQFLNDSIENLLLGGIGTYATLFRYGEEGPWAYGDRGGRVRLDPTSVPDGTSSLVLLAGSLLALGVLARRIPIRTV